MFSKKTMVVAGALILIALNALVFSVDIIRKSSFYEAAARAAIFLTAPVQEACHSALDLAEEVWTHYFFLVSVSYENERLRKELALAHEKSHECRELELANERLRELVRLNRRAPYRFLAAEVIALDPAAWYQSVMINKGSNAGIQKADPVLTANGIVGHVLHAAGDYATVLLIIDRNSAVDAMVQRTRTRGIARGTGDGKCRLEYTLRKEALEVNDIIMSSGYDGIYPKGFRIGHVSKVVRRNTGLFQDVEVTPFVDFKRLEEVMVLINTPTRKIPENP
jgi:rod shape-determining protein MreC